MHDLQICPKTGFKNEEPVTNLQFENFFSRADDLRKCFTDHFKDPHSVQSGRFVWDYWHIESQYSQFRTPADQYFENDLFQKFQDHLIDWGQKNLGCNGISSPWLSFYTDGCYQELHTDSPHGPWAFVYSLTDWEDRKFSGGETQILNPKVLDYWKGYTSESGLEQNDLLTLIPPKYNALTIFDPRLPHGVRKLQGDRDPLNSRLVINGWFTEPEVFFSGSLSEDQVFDVLEVMLPKILGDLREEGQFDGIIVSELQINSKGSIDKILVKTNSLRKTTSESQNELEVTRLTLRKLSELKFAATNGNSKVNLPIIFS